MPPLGASIPSLVQRLRSSNPAAQAAAADVLSRLAGQPGPQPAAIVSASGVAALLECLHSASEDAQWLAAEALANLSCNGHSAAILAAGGVPLLVARLPSGNRQAVEAAWALHNIADDGPQYRSALVTAGGVAALTSLLQHTSSEAREAAAAALSIVPREPAGRDALAAAGALGALVALLAGSPSTLAAEKAAAALCAATYHHAANQRALLAAGGGLPLVRLLGSSGAPQQHAVGALTHASCSCAPEVAALLAELGGLPVVVRLLRDARTSEEAKVNAAWLLHNCAAAVAEHCAAIAGAGGLEALVGMLAESLPAQQPCLCCEPAVAALRAVWQFGMHQRHLAAIAAAGGIPALLPLLAHPLEAVQEDAAAMLMTGAPEAWQQCPAVQGQQGFLVMLRMTAILGLLPQELLQLPRPPSPPQQTRAAEAAAQAAVEAAAQLAAEAPVAAQPAAPAAAAPAMPAPRPPRVCAAPGCGATDDLFRCGGYRVVRYCSEACSRAHWRQHKAECWRVQAERAAAAPDGGK